MVRGRKENGEMTLHVIGSVLVPPPSFLAVNGGSNHPRCICRSFLDCGVRVVLPMNTACSRGGGLGKARRKEGTSKEIGAITQTRCQGPLSMSAAFVICFAVFADK